MITIDGEKWFTLKEMADMFVKKPQTISNWRRCGRIKGKKISERIYYYSEREVKKIIEGDMQ